MNTSHSEAANGEASPSHLIDWKNYLSPVGKRREPVRTPHPSRLSTLSHAISHLNIKAHSFSCGLLLLCCLCLRYCVKSPLRSLQPFMGLPGIISLGGGLPNPQLFPFQTVSVTLSDIQQRQRQQGIRHPYGSSRIGASYTH